MPPATLPPRCRRATKITGRAASRSRRYFASATRPTISYWRSGVVGDASIRKRRPIGLAPGSSTRANVSFTTATNGVDAVSVSAMSRPAMSRVSSVSK